MIKKSERPVFLNLFQIRLPIVGIMSIAHRAAGILLFISIPFWLYVLELSLSSVEDFDRAASLIKSLWLLPFYIILLWALIHHLLAGIRYLLLDIDIGIEKPAFRYTAQSVLYATPILVLILLGVML